MNTENEVQHNHALAVSDTRDVTVEYILLELPCARQDPDFIIMACNC